MPYHSIRDPERLWALLDAVLLMETDLELPSVLRRIVESACSLTGARYGALGVLDRSGMGLSEFVHFGLDEATVDEIGQLPEGAGILGLLILEPTPIRLADLSAHPDSAGFPPGHPPMRSFLGVPVTVRGHAFGNLYLTEKEGAPEFTEEDEAVVTALAVSAGIVVENARLHASVAELSMAADRERIARELHDTVIQRLFSTGLSLQSVVPRADDGELRLRIQEAVTDLDDTIRQVRTSIFALEPPPAARKGVRVKVLEVCARAGRSLRFEPEVRFSGAIDRTVPDALAAETLSVLREALSNVARHAHARSVQVDVSVDEALELQVVDDGVGLDGADSTGGRGLANMAERAKDLGGSFSVSERSGGGTEIRWRVPLAR